MVEIDWRKVDYYAVTGRGEVNAEERACAIHKQVEDAEGKILDGLIALAEISQSYLAFTNLDEILENKKDATRALCELIHSLLESKGVKNYRRTEGGKIQL